jgi:hypothetical protein
MSVRKFASAVLVCFLLFAGPLFGQEPQSDKSDTLDADQDSIPVLNDDIRRTTIAKYFHIGIGVGFMNLQGELDNDINPSPSERIGGHLLINYGLNRSFSLGLSLATGRMYGQIRSDSNSLLFTNLNVKTTIFASQLRLTYHFGFLYRNRMPGVFQPLVFAGLEGVFFNPLGDLTTASGSPYYYWKDGNIRNLPETPDNVATAQFLERDYFYETILRDADLDGLGSYPVATLAIPLGVGVDINLSRIMSISLSASYHYTFTDFLDNIAYQSGAIDPNRAIGNKRKDSYFLVNLGIKLKHNKILPLDPGSLNIPPPRLLPADFLPFDLNHDHILQKEEVIKAIDDFFNGESEFDAEMIELLVDFYNVQEYTREKIQF